MLLAIDIGNSNISVGLFDREKTLKFLASIDTDSRKTADQISIDLMNLFTLYGCDIHDVSGAILSSVVPPMNFMMEKALTRLLGKPPMVVGAGIKTGLNIRMEFNSQQLGADIVANAVSALEKYPVPIIMIDMGTATIISYISEKRTYEGGLMFPGVRRSCPISRWSTPGSSSAKTPRTVCEAASSTAPPPCWMGSSTVSVRRWAGRSPLSWPPAQTHR